MQMSPSLSPIMSPPFSLCDEVMSDKVTSICTHAHMREAVFLTQKTHYAYRASKTVLVTSLCHQTSITVAGGLLEPRRQHAGAAY